MRDDIPIPVAQVSDTLGLGQTGFIRSQRLFGLSANGDVAKDNSKDLLPTNLNLRYGGLGRESSPVPPAAFDLLAPTHIPGSWPLLGKLGNMPPVVIPKLIVYQHIQRLPQCLVRPVAEDPLGPLVENDDVVRLVNGNDPFVGHIQNGRE